MIKQLAIAVVALLLARFAFAQEGTELKVAADEKTKGQSEAIGVTVRFGFMMGAVDPQHGSPLKDLKAGYGVLVEHPVIAGLSIGGYLDFSYHHTERFESDGSRHLFGGAAWLSLGPRVSYEFRKASVRPFVALQLGYTMLFASETPFTSGITTNPEAGVTFCVDSSGTLVSIALGYSHSLLMSEEGTSHIHAIPFSLTVGKAL